MFHWGFVHSPFISLQRNRPLGTYHLHYYLDGNLDFMSPLLHSILVEIIHYSYCCHHHHHLISFERHEVLLLLVLTKAVFAIPVPQSILLELQWLFPAIICSKQLIRLQPCPYHWFSGMCRCWDWRGTERCNWSQNLVITVTESCHAQPCDHG